MYIDLNNVIHLTWHSNKDDQWEIYCANSESSFALTRITNYDSRSLNPDILVTDDGDRFITWHDDRFGPWEIMLAAFAGHRVLPLFQQNEYLSSLRNDYEHTINYVPVTITNELGIKYCINNIIVEFYKDRTLENLAFSIKRSDYPFAFVENFDMGTANDYVTAN